MIVSCEQNRIERRTHILFSMFIIPLTAGERTGDRRDGGTLHPDGGQRGDDLQRHRAQGRRAQGDGGARGCCQGACERVLLLRMYFFRAVAFDLVLGWRRCRCRCLCQAPGPLQFCKAQNSLPTKTNAEAGATNPLYKSLFLEMHAPRGKGPFFPTFVFSNVPSGAIACAQTPLLRACFSLPPHFWTPRVHKAPSLLSSYSYTVPASIAQHVTEELP